MLWRDNVLSARQEIKTQTSRWWVHVFGRQPSSKMSSILCTWARLCVWCSSVDEEGVRSWTMSTTHKQDPSVSCHRDCLLKQHTHSCTFAHVLLNIGVYALYIQQLQHVVSYTDTPTASPSQTPCVHSDVYFCRYGQILIRGFCFPRNYTQQSLC